MTQRCLALLGRRDSPIDAVEEYCTYLASALPEFGIQLELVRIDWEQHGWRGVIRELSESALREKDAFFLLQYTALAWSRRGFSWRVLRVLRTIKQRGGRCGIVFHDVEPYFGNRLIDRIRRQTQLATMRRGLALADLAVVTIPSDKIPWVGSRRKPVFIPVGANLPAPETAWRLRDSRVDAIPAVAVFSLSPGQLGTQEAQLISRAALHVAGHIGKLRLVVIGRNTEELRSTLHEALYGKPVELLVRGVLPAEEVVKELGACDALLNVRGPISSSRGSAIAGIACGLPVIAREGWETAGPIRDAGVVLVPRDATDEFGPALLRVLTDKTYRDSLAERSRCAQADHFSWHAIAAKLAEALAKGSG
jgi:glycosyltransferase involved in cell wall biosynthesis